MIHHSVLISAAETPTALGISQIGRTLFVYSECCGCVLVPSACGNPNRFVCGCQKKEYYRLDVSMAKARFLLSDEMRTNGYLIKWIEGWTGYKNVEVNIEWA